MLYLLDNTPSDHPFPPVTHAETEPDGLLAVGGDLSPTRLLAAYRQGIFPWFSDDQPILWWSPNPRTVLFPDQIKISRSLAKTLRNKPFRVYYDRSFDEVLDCCSETRADGEGTWITDSMKQAYSDLHQLGYAHSVETWHEGKLVGGLYGVVIGKVFFGESMFSKHSDASKVALVRLCERLIEEKFGVIDCQISSPHLTSLGATEIERGEFSYLLSKHCNCPDTPKKWEKFQ